MSSPRFRFFSGLELFAGALVVIGHNVFHLVPNEVLILFAAGMLSARLRNGSLAGIGFVRPRRMIFVVAGAAAILRLALGEWVIDPWTAHYWPPAELPELADEIRGNVGAALAA